MNISVIFAVAVVLFFTATLFAWYLFFDAYCRGKYDREEATPYKEQERPYVDPKEFNEVMKHKAKERKRLYRGKAL